jgi:hypothetical protein
LDIHKPKPWHGVREFLKEYVIIVVGVLTALGAEQGVEWLHWRHEVAQAHADLKDEVEVNARWFRYSTVEDACLLGRLPEYAAWAKGGAKPAFIGVATFPVTGESVWDIVKASQVVTHMPLQERVAYSRLYNTSANEMLVMAEVRKAATQLYRYEDEARLPPEADDRLSGDVAEMRQMLTIHRSNAAVLLKQATDLIGPLGPMSEAGKARLTKTCGGALPPAAN